MDRQEGLLNCKSVGTRDGLAILFLHGFMGSLKVWEPVVEKLSPSYQCLAVDLPGHGASVGLGQAGCYSMEYSAAALANLLQAFDIGRCTVVGYSMGGRLALYFALRYPERCTSLVLESASPGLRTERERRARRRLDEERAGRIEQDVEAFLKAWYRQPLFASLARHPGLRAALIETRLQNDPSELARSLRGMGTGRQPSLWGRLDALEMPVLALAGALDERYVEVVMEMERVNPRIQVAIVPEAGHNVHAERPAAFLEHLTSFLSTA